MIMVELVSTPEEALGRIPECVYNIKVKCLACSEGRFIPYTPPVIKEGKLIIGEHLYPLKLIEALTVRCKNEYGKWENRYKIESRYFRQFLNGNALDELGKFSGWPGDGSADG